MPLIFQLASAVGAPIRLGGITPDGLRGMAPAEIARLQVPRGNGRVALGDLFRISGDAADGRLEFEGDLGGIHEIGVGMTGGEIVVRGNVGRHAGAGMTGGVIQIHGDAGDWLGCEMKGGLIHVGGSAGDHIGAAYAGSRLGMTEGTLVIEGSAGSHLGESMRRGLIAIGGDCGDAAGLEMIAGTILVFGDCGRAPGAGMRRGTIGVFGAAPVPLLPTFRPAGQFRPLFLRLILRELERLGFPPRNGLSDEEFLLYHGDLVGLGKGEVWCRGDGGTP
ncbi:MAG: formylmethanofuran dehydrogenase subunit C [Isosphaeraceae bacterium]